MIADDLEEATSLLKLPTTTESEGAPETLFTPDSPVQDPTTHSCEEVDEAAPDRHLAGSAKTAVTLFKALVGPGTLFLPSGMKNAGLATGASMTAVAGCVTILCIVLLLDTADRLSAQGQLVYGFGDIGQHLYGKMGKAAVNAAIITCQMGFCTAYCVFIAENIQSVIFETSGCDLSGIWASEGLVYLIIAMVIPLEIPFVWVRQIKYFALTNFLANVIIILSVGWMLGSNFSKMGKPVGKGPVINFKSSGILPYLGTTMYLFEGFAAMAIPVKRSMKHPENLPSLMIGVAVVVVALQIVFSFSVVWVYREETESIATLNYSKGSVPGGIGVVEVVQLTWCVAVFLTFPLQLFPAAKILERFWFPDRHSGNKWAKNAIRTGMVITCMAISIGGYSSVDNLVAIIGALGCIPLAIIFPAIFHWKVCTAPGGPQEGRIFTLDLAIAIFGMMAMVIAVITAVMKWVTADFSAAKCVPGN